MNRYKYLVENIAIFGIGTLLSKIVVFLLLAFYTKYLTTSEFGDSELIITTISLVVPVVTLSISDAVMRFLLGKDDPIKVVTNGFFIVVFGALIILALYPLFSPITFISQYFIYIFLLYLGTSFEQLFFNINKGFENVKLCSFTSLVSVIALIIGSYYLVVLHRGGIAGYLSAMILSHFASSIYLFFGGRLYKYIKRKNLDKTLLRGMLAFSIPFIPSTIAWWMNTTIDRYLIVFFLGSSLNGIFSAAAKIPSVISILTAIFNQAWQISGIKEYESSTYSTFFSNIYNVFSATIISLCSILILALPFISDLLFKGEFGTAWIYVPFLVMGAIYSGLGGVLAPVYLAFKKTAILMYSTIVGAVVNIIVNLLFLEKFGIQVASISSAVSFLIIWIIRLCILRKYVKVKIKWMLFVISNILLLCEILVFLTGIDNTYSIIPVLCLLILLLNLFSIASIISKSSTMIMGMIKRRRHKNEDNFHPKTIE